MYLPLRLSSFAKECMDAIMKYTLLPFNPHLIQCLTGGIPLSRKIFTEFMQIVANAITCPSV